MRISGSTIVAGVVGRPIAHSLSPLLHNAWLQAAQIDGAYVPFSPAQDRFRAFVEGLRGGAIRGLNVTLPFKEQALALADMADVAASASGAANLLLFHPGGEIEARNTDGIGLITAFTEQAPLFHVKHAPVVILGAGGAARGAAVALKAADCPEIRIVNRTESKSAALAQRLGGARSYSLARAADAFTGAGAVINATSAGLAGAPDVDWPLHAVPPEAVIMDMVYQPLETPFLLKAKARNLSTVDGLAMLIGQARPSFEAFFGVVTPSAVDARTLLLPSVS